MGAWYFTKIVYLFIYFTSGEQIAELCDQDKVKAEVCDLFVEGDQLLVPCYGLNHIRCYEMLYE